MKRRKALQQTAWLVGTAAALPALGMLESACQNPQSVAPPVKAVSTLDVWKPRVLSPEQNETVMAVTEAIIPTTDTPGAKTVKVNEFIDDLLADWYKPDEKVDFLDGIDQIDRYAQNAYKQPFAKCTAEQQNAIVKKMASTNDDFWKRLKGVTLEGYYTSEIGASMEMKYQVVFPDYHGDIPFKDVGRPWS